MQSNGSGSPGRPSPILPPMAASIRDLKVWQEAVALAADIVRSSRQAARRETKVVTDQLMLSALAAASTIADGYGRYTAPEQRQLYRAAKRELLRLETNLAIARQADLIPAPNPRRSLESHPEREPAAGRLPRLPRAPAHAGNGQRKMTRQPDQVAPESRFNPLVTNRHERSRIERLSFLSLVDGLSARGSSSACLTVRFVPIRVSFVHDGLERDFGATTAGTRRHFLGVLFVTLGFARVLS